MASLACLAAAVLTAATLAAGAARAQTITVTHWGAAFYGAPYAVAMEKGFFKAHGVSVTGALTSQGGGTSVRNMLASDLPVGEVALSAAVQAADHGVGLKIIAGGVDSVADILWMAKKGSKLTSLKDIEHHTVGYTSPGSVTNMLILMAMKAHNIDASTVKLVPVGGIGANVTAVLNGAIDTGMCGEPVWSENEAQLQPVFWVKDVLPPNMMQTVVVTTDEFAAAHAAELKGLLAARKEGVDYIMAHPDEAADITAKAYSSNRTDLYRKVFRNLVAIHYWSDDRLDYAGMDRMVEGLAIVGEMSGKPDWSKLVDTAFLPSETRP
ncbi:MAG TPA: ABC transporter substrate-binding protein [Acetobacteraceae bacterium]|nr:ABC transporter substrate-binding protein [Acetobacteraceae bacterium]